MLIKAAELVDSSLDWAVAKCEGMTNLRKNPHRFDSRLYMDGPEGNGRFIESLNYSTDWAQGGPIIEREGIDIYHVEQAGPVWEAEIQTAPKRRARGKGSTPLIASMRCFVATKLGNEIDVPDELVFASKKSTPKI